MPLGFPGGCCCDPGDRLDVCPLEGVQPQTELPPATGHSQPRTCDPQHIMDIIPPTTLHLQPTSDGFVESSISALRAIFEESHVRISTINSSKIARALILNFLQSRLKTTFYEAITSYNLQPTTYNLQLTTYNLQLRYPHPGDLRLRKPQNFFENRCRPNAASGTVVKPKVYDAGQRPVDFKDLGFHV